MSLILQDEIENYAEFHNLELQDLLVEIDYEILDLNESDTELNVFRNEELIFTIKYTTLSSGKGSKNSAKIVNNIKRYYIEEEIE